ncbi:MAG: glycosyltransferase [Bacteroidota bacterium]
MLSILIPIYNFDCRQLVSDLRQQCLAEKIAFEIICFDDGSKHYFKDLNQSFSQLDGISYRELPRNLGRAKIRNELAKAAQYTYLLFLDCDSKVVSETYIKHYLAHLQPTTLLYGGRTYAQKPPLNNQLSLHYFFGLHREKISYEERKTKPYHSFMTNNFLIPKAVFFTIRFEEKIADYGHEDTLFGMALEQRGIPIIHLDNPLEHLGLETTATFLKKQRTAIKNLYTLHQENRIIATKLLQTFVNLKKYRTNQLVLFTLNKLQPIIWQQLHKRRPNLFFLDLFKLHYLLQIDTYGIDDIPS